MSDDGADLVIVVSGVVTVAAADREAALAAALQMATETRKEAGCLGYSFYTDIEDETRIRVFEEWESGEALGRHFATPHMAEFRAALAKIRIERGSIYRYEIADRTPLS